MKIYKVYNEYIDKSYKTGYYLNCQNNSIKCVDKHKYKKEPNSRFFFCIPFY